MKKKKTIIYAVVGAVIVLALVVSRYVNWPVDYDNASGDIAKSSHFSRKTADGNVGNMRELLMNDEEFKNGILTAYIVMKNRAEQFNALVDMSAEVAGDIPEFEPVLKEMKEAVPMIQNVCASLEAAGKDLNAVLGGEEAEDLEQNTANASLAYGTLQKQNNLATQFFKTADSYMAKTTANDRLKMVRDLWVDYQQMTAALTKDEELAQELGKLGYQLAEDKRAAVLGSFSENCVVKNFTAESMSAIFSVESSLSEIVKTTALNFDQTAVLNKDIVALNKELVSALNKELAALNREQAALNREQATLNREEAALNREQAALNKVSVSLFMGLCAGDNLGYLQGDLQTAMMSLSQNNALGQVGVVRETLGYLNERSLGMMNNEK